MQASKVIQYKPIMVIQLIMLCFVSSGCHMYGTGIDSPPDPNGPHVRYPEYGWGFVNRTDLRLESVALIWLGADGRPFTSSAGALAPIFGSKENNLGWAPLPARGTMHWRRGYGEPEQTQEVEIAGVIPDVDRFSGTIWLKFDGTKWEVIPLTPEQTLRRMKAGLTSTP